MQTLHVPKGCSPGRGRGGGVRKHVGHMQLEYAALVQARMITLASGLQQVWQQHAETLLTPGLGTACKARLHGTWANSCLKDLHPAVKLHTLSSAHHTHFINERTSSGTGLISVLTRSLLAQQAAVNIQLGSVSMDGALGVVRGLLEKASVAELGTEERDVVTLAHNSTVAEAMMVRPRSAETGAGQWPGTC